MGLEHLHNQGFPHFAHFPHAPSRESFARGDQYEASSTAARNVLPPTGNPATPLYGPQPEEAAG
jgi:hypothetical protein